MGGTLLRFSTTIRDCSLGTGITGSDGANFSVSQASINAVTAAASVAASFSTGGTTVAISGAGALGLNIVLSDTKAFIEDSTIVSAWDVLVEAVNSSGIASVTGIGPRAARPEPWDGPRVRSREGPGPGRPIRGPRSNTSTLLIESCA